MSDKPVLDASHDLALEIVREVAATPKPTKAACVAIGALASIITANDSKAETARFLRSLADNIDGEG